MILGLTVGFVALPLTVFVLAVLPPFFGGVFGASEFELQSYASRVRGDVDRALSGPAGTIAVIDVASRKILAAKNPDFAGKQLIWPGSTLRPFVLMELRSGKLDPKQQLCCRSPLRIGACGSIVAAPRTCRRSTRWLFSFSRVAEALPLLSCTPSSRNIGK